MSVPLFFCYEFDFPRKKSVLLGTGLLIAADYVAILDDPHFQTAGLVPSVAVIIWAAFKKREGSLNALFGMFCLTAVLYSGFINTLTEISFLIFIFFISISFSGQMEQQRKEHEQSKLWSARLETELLRKIIQPHYMLNSLNALIDWLEEEPGQGIQLINSLSEEFRILSRISDKKLITFKEEIEICRSHLKIMSFRKETDYRLVTENIDPDEKIPPAIFHGQSAQDRVVEFLLKREKTDKGICYLGI